MGDIKIKVTLELEAHELRRLAYDARNYMREDGRKSWNAKEYRQAASCKVVELVAEYLKSKENLPV